MQFARLMYFFIHLVKSRRMSGHLFENSSSLSLQSVFSVLVPDCQFSFLPPLFLEWHFPSDCASS